ncbi:retrovirus-related Pol polyprotein from transposon 412 [Trichonephila clavipes]|nr:retrovirus-related Pol polyprotein from transposon 412 [Trichonephila clavipes]
MEYIPGKSNVIADMLPHPACNEENELCEVCTVAIDVPSRYTPDSENKKAQLVISSHERTLILKNHHDAPMAGHYGAEGTYTRIAKNYYWTGMRKYTTDYVKNCPDCIKYKATNQKPSGLLQTPMPAQRFETLVIELFGPLPESKDGKRWILIIEDCTTKWVELFALPNATAKECAITLIEEVLLRYGIPRRLISDNGTQFVSAVMQQICYILNIHQSLIPVYHPQANPVERKNRDLKPRLAIFVQDKHDCWSEKLPFIRFALNTAKCETTGQTTAFLNFGRELRNPSEVVNDIRVVIQNDNFVPEITPYLKKFAKFSTQIREVVE